MTGRYKVRLIVFFIFVLNIMFFSVAYVASAATGEVQFSISSQYTFGTAGSYTSNGNVYSKVFDGDYLTWWDAPNANGGYVGVDLTVPAKVTTALIAPRLGYSTRLFGTLIQGATVSSSTGPWTTLYTVPSYPPHYPARQYASFPINTGSQYYRYYRIVPPNGAYGAIAELRFVGVASSTTQYIPVVPVVSPSGGRYAVPTVISITSSTTDAVIYYTVDGTTPTWSGGAAQGTTKLYSGPIVASSSATTTVKAIAVSSGTYVSDVSTAYNFYISPSILPVIDWNDTSGHPIEGHDGGISYFNGRYYWYGENFNNIPNEVELVGIQAYSSTDLLNWKNEGLVVYTAAAYKLRRPHVIYNATSSLYVMWARNANNGRFFIATSTTPNGSFTIATSSYYAPGGYGNNDIDLFKDTDGTAYVVFTSNDSTKIIIYKLSDDYLSITGSVNISAANASRDAPAMFKRGSVYFLVSSGQNGWTSTNVKYSTTTSPLGTWSALTNPFQVATENSTTGYNTISSDVIHVTGRTDGYIYAGERYDASGVTTGSLYNSKFVWLPIVFPTAGTMTISWQPSWDLDSTFTSSILPTAASNINVVKTSSSEATISWTNNETTGYSLYLDRASDINFTQNVTSRVLTEVNQTYADTTVAAGNVYYYRTRTVNAAGTANSTTGIANYSLASDVIPPTVSLLSPSSNAVIIGKNVLLSATSSDDIAISSVYFYVNNIFVGSAVSTTSSSNDFYWDSTTISDGTFPLVAVAIDGANNEATTSPINIVVSNNVPMLFTSTSTVLQNSTSTITLTGNATSWTAGSPGTPTFTVSGGSGASIVSQTVVSATTSTIVLGAGTAVGSLSIHDPSTSVIATITVVADNVVPIVDLTTPANGATLTGTVTLTASSSDNVGIASVQFKLDSSVNIGALGTTSPYSISWSTIGTSNGSHTIVAVVSDMAQNHSTSTVASVIVNNAGLSSITTLAPSATSTFSIVFNGLVTNDGGASTTVRGFNYGLSTSYTASTTESGAFNIGTFSTTTTGLSCATTYHVRAFATNLSGTAFGSDKTFTTLTCPVANVSGEVQYSVSPAYQFGLTPSYLNIVTHVPSYAFDGDTLTWWDTTATNGTYIGLDLTVPAQVTRMRIAPHHGYTVRIYGATLQGSNATSSNVGPWTNIYTIPPYPPYYAQKQLNEILIDTGGAAYRYYRLVMANGINGHVAELRLIGLSGTTTPYLPVAPTISPTGGRYDLPVKVRISDITTDASIYYTTDGSVPTFSGGLPQGTTVQYSGPFIVSNVATTTVRAISVSNGTFVSELSDSAQFYISTDYKPGQDWLDTTGHLIESHDGGLGYFNGKYYWYGQIFNGNDPENESVGISAYSSPDLINWKDEGPIVYLGRTHLLERPHVIYNDTTHKYVMWAHNIISYPNSRAYIAYSDTPTGPFTLSSSTYNPDGMGLNDMNLFKDTDGTAYVLYSNGNNTKFVISQLTSDYLGTIGTNITPAILVNREAPAMFKRNGVYYLMTSGVTGWPPNLNKYSTSTSVLGTWSSPISPFQVSELQNVNTSYSSQTTDVLTISGRTDAYVYIGDRNDNSSYIGGSLYNSRHIWLPMIFDGAGNMSISWYPNWNLNTYFTTSAYPGAATGLSVGATNSEVDISWTNNATTSFTLFVDRATDSGFTQNVVSDLVASTTTSYVDTYNYSPSTTYYYRIRTLTGAGTTNSATASTVVPEVTPPTYTLSYAPDSNGTLTGSTTQAVTSGGNGIQVTAVPNTNYHFTTWSDGVLTASRTDTNITQGITVTASFALTVVAPDLSAPIISSVVITPGTNSFTAAWTTDQFGSTQVLYGLISIYALSTTETTISSRVA